MNPQVEQALKQGKWPQVVLLVGTRLSNKQEFSQQVMRQLICQHAVGESCLSCPVELRVHPDIYQVEPVEDESLISLEAVKDGVKHIYHSPLLGAKKILYIQAAELLSTEAANALLKPIEDYHPNRHIFLLTTSAERILPTIRSRSVIINCLQITQELTTSSSPLQADLGALPLSILDRSPQRFQLVERIHAALAKLPNSKVRQLLTEEAAKWQTIFLRAHRTSEHRPQQRQLRALAEQCEQLPQLTQQHVSIRSILETLITTV